jgi:hypothetical protein
MGLFDAGICTNLNIIRTIRNCFAHSRRLIDFDHPLVASELQKIQIPKLRKKKFKSIKAREPKTAYLSLCLALTSELITRRTKSDQATRQRRLKTTPLYRALAPALGMGSLYGIKDLSKADLESNRLLNPPSRTADPSREVPKGWLSGLLPFLDHPGVTTQTPLVLRESEKKESKKK